MQEFILLVLTMLAQAIGQALGSGVQNKMQGHDAFKSAKVGLAGGIVGGIFAFVVLAWLIILFLPTLGVLNAR